MDSHPSSPVATPPPVRPVPARATDLLRTARAGQFAFSESRHHTPIALHAHEQPTVTMLLDGAFEESYRGRRSESCETASVLFRPAGEPHADRFGRHGALNLVIEVEPARVEMLRGYTGALEALVHRRDPALDAIARRMHRELAAPDDATALALEGLALELLALTARRGVEAQSGRGPAPVPPWLEQVRELLHARSGDRALRIADLAAAADVHPVYLARAFRSRFGATPGAYLRRLRLMRAADRIVSTTDPLSRIALDAGFADQSHFTRAFRVAFGTTPARWRGTRH